MISGFKATKPTKPFFGDRGVMMQRSSGGIRNGSDVMRLMKKIPGDTMRSDTRIIIKT